MRRLVIPSVAFFTAMMIAGLATAQLTSLRPRPSPAPAPLVAAGLPAFVALGGGAVIGRLVRRRKTAGQDVTADTEAASIDKA